MKCETCGTEGEKGWKYCPRCGSRQSRLFNVGDIFTRMRKQMTEITKEMDHVFERDIEAVDLSPFFKKLPQGSGFTIKIISGTGMKPHVHVKTFGNVSRERVEEQLEAQLGMKPTPHHHHKHVQAQTIETSTLPTPKTTEEPSARISSLGNKVIVDIDLPGVKKEKDIEVLERESSVEVKAIAGDKGFFKILTKPPEFTLKEKTFKKGSLHLEFA